MELFVDKVVKAPTLLITDTNMISGVAMRKYQKCEWRNENHYDVTVQYLKEFQENYFVKEITDMGGEGKEILYSVTVKQKKEPLNAIWFTFQVEHDTLFLVHIQPMKFDVK